jgi:hypothetical protein
MKSLNQRQRQIITAFLILVVAYVLIAALLNWGNPDFGRDLFSNLAAEAIGGFLTFVLLDIFGKEQAG